MLLAVTLSIAVHGSFLDLAILNSDANSSVMLSTRVSAR